MTEPVAAPTSAVPVDLTRLEELDKARTPGEWYAESEPSKLPPQATHGYMIRTSAPEWPRPACVRLSSDAEFIAALRNAAPQLLAAFRAVERVRALHDFLGHGRGFCMHCAEAWPCPTIRALGCAE